jgi:hypothetical protein
MLNRLGTVNAGAMIWMVEFTATVLASQAGTIYKTQAFDLVTSDIFCRQYRLPGLFGGSLRWFN